MRIKDYESANNIHANDVLLIDGLDGTRTVKREQIIPEVYEAEAWAKGTMDGVSVTEQHPAYHNNAKYHAQNAAKSATSANTSKEAAASSAAAANASKEAAAASAQSASSSKIAANVSKDAAASSATSANASKEAAAASAASIAEDAAIANQNALKAEGLAVGEQNGEPVGPGSPYYNQSARYYADVAQAAAAGGIIPKGTCTFAALPALSQSRAGDMWNISDYFVTTNDFREGPGIEHDAGANVYKTSDNKWDVFEGKNPHNAMPLIAPVETSPSTHAYNKGNQLIYDDILYKATRTITKGDELSNINITLSEPIIDQLNDKVEVIDYEEDIYGVNLLPYPYANMTQTISGITFTVNSDGSITLNGTSTEVVRLDLLLNDINLEPDQQYVLSGCPSGGDRNTKYILELCSSSITKIDKGNKVNVTGITAVKRVYIRVASGYTANNVVFRPMLRKATIQDDTYRPYNQQSIQHQLTDQTNVLGAKNLIPYPYTHTTRTVFGVTMTDNGDGSVTLNGTATAQCYFSFVAGVKIPCKKQILGKEMRITLQYTSSSQNGNWYVFFNTSRDSTDVKLFKCYPSSKASDKVSATGYVSSVDDGNDFLEISIPSGFSATNLKIYPMLTLASDPDNTYVPYAMTNRELTGKIGTTDISGIGQTVTGAIAELGNFSKPYKLSKEWTTTINGSTFYNYIYATRVGGMISLIICAHQTTGNRMGVVYTLPQIFRPCRDIKTQASNDASGNTSSVGIYTDGRIVVDKLNGTYPISIAAISYMAADLWDMAQDITP